MALTIAELQAILEVQTKGFSDAITAMNTMTTSFANAATKVQTALDKIESASNKSATSSNTSSKAQAKAAQAAADAVAAAAAKAAAAQEDAAERAANAMTKQNNILFNAEQKVKQFGATAALVWPKSTYELEQLNNSFNTLQAKLTSGALSYEELSNAVNMFTADLNRANSVMKLESSIESQNTAMIKQNESAILSQANTMARITQRYQNLIVSVQKSNLTDEQKTASIKRLESEYQRLATIMGNGVLNKGESSVALNTFNAAAGDIARTVRLAAPTVNDFNAALLNVSKGAQIAMGPLSGISSRFLAFDFLVKDTSFAFATMAAAFVGSGVLMVKGVEFLAQFQKQLTQIGVAAGVTGKDLDALGQRSLELSKSLMTGVNEILTVETQAAQAGVATKNLESFATAIIKLKNAANIPAEEGVTALAKIINVMGITAPSEIEHVANMLAVAGNKAVDSAEQVANMAKRISQSTANLNMSTQDVLGLALALNNLGIPAEQAGTDIAIMFRTLNTLVASSGGKLKEFEQVVGMTAEDFKKLKDENPYQALQLFITGLSKVNDKASVLKDLGFVNTRAAAATSTLTKNTSALADAMKTLSDQGKGVAYLNDAWAQVNDTLSRQTEGLTTNLHNILIVMAESSSGPLLSLIKGLNSLTSNYDALGKILQYATLGIINISAAWGLNKVVISPLYSLYQNLTASEEKVAVAAATEAESITAATAAMRGNTVAAEGMTVAQDAAAASMEAASTAGVATAARAAGVIASFASKATLWLTIASVVVEAGLSIADGMGLFKKGAEEATPAVDKFTKQLETYDNLISQVSNGNKDLGKSIETDLTSKINNALAQLGRLKDAREKAVTLDLQLNAAGGGESADVLLGSDENLKAIDAKMKDLGSKVAAWQAKLANVKEVMKDAATRVKDAGIEISGDLVGAGASFAKNIGDMIFQLNRAEEGLKILQTQGLSAYKAFELSGAAMEKLAMFGNLNPTDQKKMILQSASPVGNTDYQKSNLIGVTDPAKINAVLSSELAKSQAMAKGAKTTEEIAAASKIYGQYIIDLAVGQGQLKGKLEESTSAMGKHANSVERAARVTNNYYEQLSSSTQNLKAQVDALASGDTGKFRSLENQAAAIKAVNQATKDLGDDPTAALKKYQLATGTTTQELIDFAKEHGLAGTAVNGFKLKVADMAAEGDIYNDIIKNGTQALKDQTTAVLAYQKGIRDIDKEIANIGVGPYQKSINDKVNSLEAPNLNIIDKQNENINNYKSQLAVETDPAKIRDLNAGILTSQQAINAAMNNYTASLGEATEKATELASKQKEMADSVAVADEIRDGLDQIFMSSSQGFKGMADAVDQFLIKLVNMVTELYVIKPFLDSMFGQQGSQLSGPGGGFLSDVFDSLFGGSGSGSGFGGSSLSGAQLPLQPMDLIGSLMDSIPGFATGGSFKVGGAGGTDSKLVAFKATPGESVVVGHDQAVNSLGGMMGPSGGSSNVEVHINDYRSGSDSKPVSVQQGRDSSGKKMIYVTIMDAVKTGILNGDLDTPMKNAYGSQRQGTLR